jgi:hypothetical protein
LCGVKSVTVSDHVLGPVVESAAPALGLIAQQSQRKIPDHLVLEISPDVVWVENLEPLSKNVWYTWRHSRSPFMNFQALQKAYSSM